MQLNKIHHNKCKENVEYTVVWEKLVVGNIHEKKSKVKNFHLSRLQTIINCSVSLW